MTTPKIQKERIKKIAVIGSLFALVMGATSYFFYRNILISFISSVVTLIIIIVYFILIQNFAKTARIRKIENTFPDFLQLMSSNLRAGMTIDKAMLLSSRPEFAPLDKEILKIGKDITVGKNIEQALIDMSKRINSPKIEKIIHLIISGIKAGGDLAILLDETASSLRERAVLEKKAASNVLMYIIFIFLAVSIFAPALFALSNVLVKILTNLFSGLPELGNTQMNVPFTLSKVNISVSFINYFSVFFIVIINFLAALVLGLVSKGEEKQGLKYLPVMIVLSLGIFFLTKIIIDNLLSGFF